MSAVGELGRGSGREEVGGGGTGEKSAWKLRPIMLMSGARVADPGGLYRPPWFVFNSVSYSVFDVRRLKPLQVTILR